MINPIGDSWQVEIQTRFSRETRKYLLDRLSKFVAKNQMWSLTVELNDKFWALQFTYATSNICQRIILAPHNEVSVLPASGVHYVAPTVLVGSISYLHIGSSNFRKCVACRIVYKIWNFAKLEFLAIVLKCVTLTLSCFDLGYDVNH